MKVICINDHWFNEATGKCNGPAKGDTDIVTGEEIAFGHLFYSLESFGPTEFFKADYFIPISDISIEELIGERELQEA